MAGIPLDKANLLALVLETLLYGVFCVLFVATIYILVQRQGRLNKKLFGTEIAIFILASLHLILDVMRGTDAFVTQTDGSADAYFLDLSNPLETAKTVVYVTLTLVGDSFVIYRCYIVWSRTWWIVPFPILLLCGTGAAGYGTVYQFAHAKPGAEVFLPTIKPWITCTFALTLATNVVCTFLIAFKIQRTRKHLHGVTVSSAGGSTLAIVVESAAVYSASVFSLMMTYVFDSNGQYMVLDLTPPLIGITFTVIILRVSLGMSVIDLQQGGATRTLRDITTIGGTRSGGRGERFGMSNTNSSCGTRVPLTVNVSHLVEVDHDHGDVASNGSQKHFTEDAV